MTIMKKKAKVFIAFQLKARTRKKYGRIPNLNRQEGVFCFETPLLCLCQLITRVYAIPNKKNIAHTGVGISVFFRPAPPPHLPNEVVVNEAFEANEQPAPEPPQIEPGFQAYQIMENEEFSDSSSSSSSEAEFPINGMNPEFDQNPPIQAGYIDDNVYAHAPNDLFENQDGANQPPNQPLIEPAEQNIPIENGLEIEILVQEENNQGIPNMDLINQFRNQNKPLVQFRGKLPCYSPKIRKFYQPQNAIDKIEKIRMEERRAENWKQCLKKIREEQNMLKQQNQTVSEKDTLIDRFLKTLDDWYVNLQDFVFPENMDEFSQEDAMKHYAKLFLCLLLLFLVLLLLKNIWKHRQKYLTLIKKYISGICQGFPRVKP